MKSIELQLIGGGDPRFGTLLAEANLPTEDLLDEGLHVFAVKAGGERVGYGGFQPCDEHHVLLRSIVIMPVHRGQGYGTALVEALMAKVAGAGHAHAWLLTNDQQTFFERNRFNQAAREAAPHAVRNMREFHDLCPETATLMFRGI